jgi:hypothetical protein
MARTSFVIGTTTEGLNFSCWVVDWHRTQRSAIQVTDLLNTALRRLHISTADADCGDLEWQERKRELESPDTAAGRIWRAIRLVDPHAQVYRNGVYYSVESCSRPSPSGVSALRDLLGEGHNA